MIDLLCDLCEADPARFDRDAVPTHVHCDGVVLTPQRRFRRGQRVEFRGAWRADDLLLVVSQMPGRRVRWRAVLRGPGLWDLVAAERKRLSDATRELASKIDTLRVGFGKPSRKW